VFGFVELYTELESCALVSKRWRKNALSYCKVGIGSLEISRDVVCDPSPVLFAVNLENIKRILITETCQDEEDLSIFLYQLSGVFTSLESIRVSDASVIDTFDVNFLSQRSCASLRELSVSSFDGDSFEVFEECGSFPAMELSNLQNLTISRSKFQQFSSSHLKTIQLHKSCSLDWLEDFENLNGLEMLASRYQENLTRIHDVLVKTLNLGILELDSSDLDTLDFRLSLSSLEVLNLCTAWITRLSLCAPQLEFLDVSGSEILSADIRSLVSWSSCFKWLEDFQTEDLCSSWKENTEHCCPRED